MGRVAALASILIVLGAAEGAQAAPRAMVVKVSDLNLATASGAAVALERAKIAAARVCGRRDFRRQVLEFPNARCRAQLVQKAVDAMNAPLVRDFHNATEIAAIGARG
ncbi:hypothetical protein DJ021_13845 [Phenylobacterium hankyongense]|uniref:UrcA family protein n=1 Tax=Phenylobacterium hankyongense TaxID=1813876 RepID=A0A328B0X6_9CAUL|nr:UrcA family protein [Phenylobacterium hankyongense]RAK60813.1 hypothetical protein DJ021_13845 [Phenylobacterium hankyongense]